MQARMTRSFTGSLMSVPSPSFDSAQQDVEDHEPSAGSDPGSSTGNKFSGSIRGILKSSIRQEVGKSDPDVQTKSLSAQLGPKLRFLENSGRPSPKSPTSSEKLETGKKVVIDRRVVQQEEDEMRKSQDGMNDGGGTQTAGSGHQTRYNSDFRTKSAKMRGQLSGISGPSSGDAKQGKGSDNHQALSNSTLSKREVEFQNWKRRMSYAPMKPPGLPPKPSPNSAKMRGEVSGISGPSSGGPKRGRGSGNPQARSNSTLSKREVEFLNWKTRMSYNPMKAAAKGKKKREEACKAATGATNFNLQAMLNNLWEKELKPYLNETLDRGHSFHRSTTLKSSMRGRAKKP